MLEKVPGRWDHVWNHTGLYRRYVLVLVSVFQSGVCFVKWKVPNWGNAIFHWCFKRWNIWIPSWGRETENGRKSWDRFRTKKAIKSTLFKRLRSWSKSRPRIENVWNLLVYTHISGCYTLWSVLNSHYSPCVFLLSCFSLNEVIHSQNKANKDRLKNLNKVKEIFREWLSLEIRKIQGKLFFSFCLFIAYENLFYLEDIMYYCLGQNVKV